MHSLRAVSYTHLDVYKRQEVLGMSDRIYVMNEGKIVGEVDGKEATQEIIMSYIMKSGKGA